MAETGAALWSFGEHYRYTHDDAWVKKIAPKLVKSCDFLIAWRRRNQKEELRGKGLGMQEGKVADPEDPFRAFMLNGYSYLGLSRVAEMLVKVDAKSSQYLKQEAEAYKQDIRTEFFAAMAKAPVVPLGDGTWCSTVPPWAEGPGPMVLFPEKGTFSHGTFTGRDAMIGPLYLIFQEVLNPSELASEWLLNFQTDLLCTRNVAFSQPYYSCHPWIHLARGEVKAFLKSYYNTFSSLADRETYTFWEHYYHVSPHKTHEEAWFLMQTRWMLYLEQGTTLKLLPGIPRAWLEQGQVIELINIASYFGPVSLRVESAIEKGLITATVECRSKCKPQCVTIRIPHPRAQKAKGVQGGIYDPLCEEVKIEPFNGSAKIKLKF
jgi:hypothetical protein